MIPSGTNRSPVDVSTQTKKLDPVSKLGVPATQVEHTGIYIVRRMHIDAYLYLIFLFSGHGEAFNLVNNTLTILINIMKLTCNKKEIVHLKLHLSAYK
jgi:hypothetical protein